MVCSDPVYWEGATRYNCEKTQAIDGRFALGPWYYKNMKRIDIKSILRNPVQREQLMVCCIVAMQELVGRDANEQQAKEAYDNIRINRGRGNSKVP